MNYTPGMYSPQGGRSQAQGQDPSAGLRGMQSDMTGYLMGALGNGLSVDGLRVLSESLSNTERDGTQRYGIDTQADVDRMKNDTQLYGIDSDAASKDFATSQNGAIIKSDDNYFRNGGTRGMQPGQTTSPYLSVGAGGSAPLMPQGYLQNRGSGRTGYGYGNSAGSSLRRSSGY